MTKLTVLQHVFIGLRVTTLLSITTAFCVPYWVEHVRIDAQSKEDHYMGPLTYCSEVISARSNSSSCDFMNREYDYLPDWIKTCMICALICMFSLLGSILMDYVLCCCCWENVPPPSLIRILLHVLLTVLATICGIISIAHFSIKTNDLEGSWETEWGIYLAGISLAVLIFICLVECADVFKTMRSAGSAGYMALHLYR